MYTVSQEQLQQHIPRDSLPQKFGGNLSINHRFWLQVCAQFHQSNSEIIDSYFVSRKQSVSNSSSDNSDFIHLNDRGLDSEDSKETVSEKQSNEEGEKDDLIDVNCIEKEVNVEKDGRYKSKRRHESDNAQNSSRVSKSSSELNDSYPANTNMEGIPPPNPCKKRPTSQGSNVWEDSIHMAEEGGMAVADLVRHVKEKGKRGLHDEYAEIRREQPSGTFVASR